VLSRGEIGRATEPPSASRPMPVTPPAADRAACDAVSSESVVVCSIWSD